MEVLSASKTDSDLNDSIDAIKVCEIGEVCGPRGCGGGVLDCLSAFDKKALLPEHRDRFGKQGVSVSGVRFRLLERFRAGFDYWASAAFFAWACTHVMAMTPTMSCAVQPRDRSFTGAAMPWVTGPKASACARRCTSL